MKIYGFKERKVFGYEEIETKLENALYPVLMDLTYHMMGADEVSFYEFSDEDSLAYAYNHLQIDDEMQAIIDKDGNTKEDEIYKYIGAAIHMECSYKTYITKKGIDLIILLAKRNSRYAKEKGYSFKFFRHKLFDRHRPDFIGRNGLYKFEETERNALYLLYYSLILGIDSNYEIGLYNPYTDTESYVRIKDVSKGTLDLVKLNYEVSRGKYAFDLKPMDIDVTLQGLVQKEYRCPCGKGRIYMCYASKQATNNFMEYASMACDYCMDKYHINQQFGVKNWFIETEDEEFKIG